jgi:hypothetical protein
MAALRKTFFDFPEHEIRAILGENAARVYGFDPKVMRTIADRIGPSIADIRGEA